MLSPLGDKKEERAPEQPHGKVKGDNICSLAALTERSVSQGCPQELLIHHVTRCLL